MNGGTISGNSTGAIHGGGVCGSFAAFTKTGGIIYGSDGGALSNTAAYTVSGAAAVFFQSKRRDLTAWETTNLSASPTSSTGAWDN